MYSKSRISSLTERIQLLRAELEAISLWDRLYVPVAQELLQELACASRIYSVSDFA